MMTNKDFSFFRSNQSIPCEFDNYVLNITQLWYLLLSSLPSLKLLWGLFFYKIKYIKVYKEHMDKLKDR